MAIAHASAAPSDSDEAPAAPLAKPITGARMKSFKGKANAAQSAAAFGHASALPPQSSDSDEAPAAPLAKPKPWKKSSNAAAASAAADVGYASAVSTQLYDSDDSPAAPLAKLQAGAGKKSSKGMVSGAEKTGAEKTGTAAKEA